MADISTELANIMSAIYGEEVRTSIHDAIQKMNTQLNSAASSTLNGLGFRGDFSSGTLDQLTAENDRGIWRLLPSGDYTDYPEDYQKSRGGLLFVYVNGSYCRQELRYYKLTEGTGADSSKVWTRTLSGGEGIFSDFTDWIVEAPLSFKGDYRNGASLNALTNDADKGIYRLLANNTYSGMPSDFVQTASGCLKVYVFGTNVVQELSYISNFSTYECVSWKRVYTGSWGEWEKNTDASLTKSGAAADAKAVGDKALLSKQVYLPVGENANLNNFYTQGIYSVMVPQGTQNWPFESTSGLLIVVNANNDLGTFITYAVAQIAICDGKYAFRSSIVGQSGPKYSDWVIYSIDDTLSVEGAAADAKAVGDAISGAVENVVSSKGLAMSTDPQHPVKDLNDYKTPGIYYVGITKVTNWAFDDNYKGVLVVFNPMTSATVMPDSIVQIAFSNGELAYRMFNGFGVGDVELWSDWIKNDNSRLLEIIESIADVDSVQNEIEATANQNYYLEKTSATTCTVKSSTGTELVIYSVAVEAKKNYRITASNVASINNAILAFATRALADNVGCTMLIDNTGGPTIDYSYSPTQDGYLFLSKGTNASMTYTIYEVEDQATITTDKTLSIENMPADSKAVGDFKEHSFKVNNPTAFTDLNDATKSGWYILPFGASYNAETCPVPANNRRILLVYMGAEDDSTTAVVTQIMFCYTSGSVQSIHTRFRAGSPAVWSDWVTMFDSVTTRNTYQARVTGSSTDLDNFTDFGVYGLSSGTSYINEPPNAPSGAKYLTVSFKPHSSTGSAYTIQEIHYLFENIIYRRIKAGSPATWDNWTRVYSTVEFNNTYQSRLAGSETNLDNFTDFGVYGLTATTSYTNEPEGAPGGAKYLTVVNRPHTSLKSAYAIQQLHYLSGNITYQRIRAGANPTWGNWSIIFSTKEISDMEKNAYQSRLAGSETDLNNLTDFGLYGLAAATSYINEPPNAPSGAKYLTVVNRPHSSYGSAYAIQQLHYLSGNITYQRIKGGSPATWSDWIILYNPADVVNLEKKTVYNSVNTEVDRYAPGALVSQGANTGDKLRVVSYNICMFNFDSQTFISDEKLYNLRKCLGKMNADVMLIQEDNEWIDALTNGTKRNTEYVYYPLYPYASGVGSVTVRSKVPLTDNGLISYTVGRNFRYGVMTIGSKRVLLISTHMSSGYTEADINTRKAQYNELFAWVNGNPIGGVSAPQFTHCIIGMDSNAHSRVGNNDDKTNLSEAAATYGYNLANGGRFGWMCSECRSKPNNAIDTIICSPNIIINNVEVHSEWYSDLYSDHVPVVSDLTLLDS